VYEPERLPPGIQNAVANVQNELIVSLATIWELSNKAAAHRLPLAGSSVQTMIERFQQLGVTFLPITLDEVLASASLPQHHSDPFDRMLIAQAIKHSFTFVTKDPVMRSYEVEVLW
jgi:PIN domain nuclease of toxin-antitoxin system